MSQLKVRVAYTQISRLQDTTDQLVSCNNKHSNPPNTAERAADVVKEKRAKEETTPISRIYHGGLQEVPQQDYHENVDPLLPTFSSVWSNNHAEGWHSKVRKLAEKAHPNIYKVVSLFKLEQAATEVTLMQVAAGRLPVRKRRYRNHERRLVTIKGSTRWMITPSVNL